MSKNTRSKIGRRQFVSTTTAGIVGAGAALGASQQSGAATTSSPASLARPGRERTRPRRADRRRPAGHRRDAQSSAAQRRRRGRGVRRLQAESRQGLGGRAEGGARHRFPAHPRQQVDRRRHPGHARSLARAADGDGLRRRQGRLRRKADVGGDRGRPGDGRGRAQASAHRPGRHAAAFGAALPAGRRGRQGRQDRRGHVGALLERRQRGARGDRQSARLRAARRPRLGHVARPGAEGARSTRTGSASIPKASRTSAGSGTTPAA